jgi:hypothetical protein
MMTVLLGAGPDIGTSGWMAFCRCGWRGGLHAYDELGGMDADDEGKLHLINEHGYPTRDLRRPDRPQPLDSVINGWPSDRHCQQPGAARAIPPSDGPADGEHEEPLR